MSYLPPFRTRRGPQIEPHFGEAEAPQEDEPTLAPEPAAPQTAAPTRIEPALAPRPGLEPKPEPELEPQLAPEPDLDDDSVPVLTQLVQAGPAQAMPDTREEPDEELVMRITDDVLDALHPTLEKLVSDAVRKALQSALPEG